MRRQRSAGRLYFDLAAMLMARLTVEGYVNFLLDVLEPATFKNEKSLFGGNADAKIAHARMPAGCGRLHPSPPAIDPGGGVPGGGWWCTRQR